MHPKGKEREMMTKVLAKQVKKDRSQGVYSIYVRMTVNDLTVRRGSDSLTDFVTKFNDSMRLIPRKNQFSCEDCYKAEIKEDWTEAYVIKLKPGGSLEKEILWTITTEKE
jgi:hypothetical protein